ncbi:hypothetical protein BSLG_003302 [Batrachochytrium salamandrivorans]|nr:hypothetical protein BSLG_003302 [Batrachochytrium salamandrivorans]
MVKIRLQNQVKELAGRPMSARHTFETIFKSEGLGVSIAAWASPQLDIFLHGPSTSLLTNGQKINSMQNQDQVHFIITPPTLDGLVTIFRKEGWRALYKGLGPSIVGVSHVAIQFPLYEKLKLVLKDSDGQIGGHEIVFASAISKMVASSVTYPHEVVRTRFQTQLSLHSNTNIEAPSLLPRSTSLNTNPILSTKAGPMASSVLENAQVAVGGSALLPKYRGILQAVRTILREEGWRGFYKGFALGLFRTVPASALTILTFEFISGTLKQIVDVNKP